MKLTSKRAAVAGAFIGGLVAAGIGVAAAQQADSPTSTTAPPPANAVVPAPGPGFGPRGMGKFGGDELGGKFGPGEFGHGVGGAIHGEFVSPDGNGGYRTMAMQIGEVTSVGSSSLTLKSADGFSKKYAVDTNTIVNSGRDGIGSVKNGDTVSVMAVVEGSTAKAVRVEDRTTLGSIRQHWFPGGPDRAGRSKGTPVPSTAPAGGQTG